MEKTGKTRSKSANDITVDVAGGYQIKFEPGHYCGKNWGFSVRLQNAWANPSLKGGDGFTAGGVMDFKDVERLYKLAMAYQKKYKRLSLEEQFK